MDVDLLVRIVVKISVVSSADAVDFWLDDLVVVAKIASAKLSFCGETSLLL